MAKGAARAAATATAAAVNQGQLTDADSRFGRLAIWRRYGWCPQCET
jgi:hypothetical protein